MDWLIRLLNGLPSLRRQKNSGIENSSEWPWWRRKFSLDELVLLPYQTSLSDPNHALVNIVHLFDETGTFQCGAPLLLLLLLLSVDTKTDMAGGLAELEHLATREDELAVLKVPQGVKVHSLKVKSHYAGFLYVLRHTQTARTLTTLAVTIWRRAHLEALDLFLKGCGGQLEHLSYNLRDAIPGPRPFP